MWRLSACFFGHWGGQHSLSISSVAQSFLTLNELQDTLLPCPKPTLGACSKWYPLSHLCHPLKSSSFVPFSSCLQSFPTSFSNESVLHNRWPKYWSFSFSISPSISPSELISFRVDWLDLLAFQTVSRVFSNTTVQKHQFFGAQLSLWSSFHIHTWLLKKTIALMRQTFVGKVMSLLFSNLSRLVVPFFQRARVF